MKYTKEEILFNQSFSHPVVYIFSNSINHKQFVLTEFVSKNPLRVRSVDASEDINMIINKGRMYASNVGGNFIDNEIFVPF